MYTLFYIITFAVGLSFAIFFVFHFRSLPFLACFHKKKWLPWALSTILTALFVIKAANIFSIWFLIAFLLFQTYVATDIIRLILKISKKERAIKRFQKIYCGGLLAFLLAGIYLLAGYLNAGHVSFTYYEITSDKLEPGKELTVAMIADLHLGTTMGVKELKEYCDKVEKKKPDVVLLVGDIFDEQSPQTDLEAACKLFGAIKSSYGTYYVYGNHDLGTYNRSYYLSKQQLEHYFTKANVKVLEDEVVLLEDSYYLIGRSALTYSGINNRVPIKNLVQGVNPEKYMILLDHQPKELTIAANQGIDLLVAGHTHGGQIWPVGLFARMFKIDELNYGEKVIDKMHAIVTSGIAGWGYPIKTGAKSEIVMITIKGEKS